MVTLLGMFEECVYRKNMYTILEKELNKFAWLWAFEYPSLGICPQS